MSFSAQQTRTKSAWTPLTNEETNEKIFQERRSLANKWYEKWTDKQRRLVLDDFLHKSRLKQLSHARSVLDDLAPAVHLDFTRHLPRFISLYIFSFLDPRSLSRCSRVCWYWSWLSSMDELWRRKCVALGWFPADPPEFSHGENHPWKTTYIENIKRLQALKPKVKESPRHDMEKLNPNSDRSEKRCGKGPSRKPLPWRGSDPKPSDISWNNYLDNDDFMSLVNKLRRRGYYSAEVREMMKNARNKINSGLSQHHRSYSAPKINKIPPSPTRRGAKPQPRPVSSGGMLEPKRGQAVVSGGKLQHSESDDGLVEDNFEKQPWEVMNFDDED